MNLKVLVKSVKDEAVKDSAYIATVTANDVVKDITFNVRSGSEGKALIAYLPKEIKALGTAGNLTIKTADFIVGKTLDRDSVPGTARIPGASKRSKTVTPDPLFDGIDEAGAYTVYSVAPDGTKAVRFTSTDPDLIASYKVATAFSAWRVKMVNDSLSALKVYSDHVATATREMGALGIDEATITALLAKQAPKLPDLDLPADVTFLETVLAKCNAEMEAKAKAEADAKAKAEADAKAEAPKAPKAPKTPKAPK